MLLIIIEYRAIMSVYPEGYYAGTGGVTGLWFAGGGLDEPGILVLGGN